VTNVGDLVLQTHYGMVSPLKQAEIDRNARAEELPLLETSLQYKDMTKRKQGN
jgi:hypothetical protein